MSLQGNPGEDNGYGSDSSFMSSESEPDSMAPPVHGTKEGRYTIDTIRSNTLLYKVKVTSLI